MIVEVIEKRLAKDRRCVVKCDKCGKTKEVRWWGPCYKEQHFCRSCTTIRVMTGRHHSLRTREKISETNRRIRGGTGVRLRTDKYIEESLPIASEHPRMRKKSERKVRIPAYFGYGKNSG